MKSRQIKVEYEQIRASPEEIQRRLDTAFEIFISEIIKAIGRVKSESQIRRTPQEQSYGQQRNNTNDRIEVKKRI